MKIAIVNQPWNDCPPAKAGSISTWVYEVARRMAHNHSVLVYARESAETVREETKDGILFSRISLQPDESLLWYLQKLADRGMVKPPIFSSRWFYLNYALRVAWDVRQKDCDIVHVNNFSQFVPIIRLLNPRIKIILHMHCEWLSQLDKKVIHKRLCQTSRVIGCSDYITNKIRHRFPFFSDRCDTIFNGVDIEDFSKKARNTDGAQKKTILFVGRVSPEKGVHDLIEAFVQVVKTYPDVRLKIVGPIAPTPKQFIVDLENVSGESGESGEVANLDRFYDRDYKVQLKELIPDSLRGQVDFSGVVPHRMLSEHYRQADFLVNPSYSESFGMTLIEAMACGIPVIATRVGGMPEVLNYGGVGRLVAAGDITALTVSMLELLQDDALRDEMSEKGRNWVEQQYSWDKIVMSLNAVYSRALSEKATS